MTFDRSGRIRSIAALTIAGVMVYASTCRGQESVQPSFWEMMLEPAAVMTKPMGKLFSIRRSVPCSKSFAGVSKVNLGAGIRVGYAMGNGDGMRLRSLSLAVGLEDLSSSFKSRNDQALDAFDAVNGRYRVVTTDHTTIYTLSYLRLAPSADIGIGERMLVRVGPNVGLPLSASSRESEAIVSPSNATFMDFTQEREISEGTGTIDDAGMLIGLHASVAYRLPLGRRLFFEPNIGIDFGLTHVQPQWSLLVLRGGISLGYMSLPAPPSSPPLANDPPIAEKEIPRNTPRESPFVAQTSVELATDRLPIELRRQIVARYIPVLPTVFFEQDAAALGERYIQFAPPGEAPRGGEAASFDEGTVSSNAERAHYHTLNIFARRLAAYPRARVTLTGTTSRDETDRPGLAAARATAVADYLATVWGIARNRITVRSRLDPAVPSNSEYAEGLQENRRVELEFSDDVISRPLQLRSVEPVTEPSEIAFRAQAKSESSIEGWNIDVVIGGRSRTVADGNGPPDGEYTWHLEPEDRERMLTSGTARYRLSVHDSAGRTMNTPTKEIPLKLDTTISVVTSPDQPDNSAEFLLVTFDFDRAELTRRGKLELQSILDRIGPGSRVSITGYTDPIGETERNRTLALERAKRVAASMPAGTPAEYRGALPEEAPYSRTSPEGRFLSRTVRVVITNPK